MTEIIRDATVMMLNGNEWVTLAQDATVEEMTRSRLGRATVMGGGRQILVSSKPKHTLMIKFITNEESVLAFVSDLKIGNVRTIKATYNTGEIKGDYRFLEDPSISSEPIPHFIELILGFAQTTE